MNNENIWRVKREKILSDFADAVKRKDYEKIEYRQWRELSASKSAYIKITMSHDVHNLNYELETVGEGGGKYYAKSSDRTFGSFIACHWKEEKYTYTMNSHLAAQINDIKSGLSTINFMPDYSDYIQDLFDKYSAQKENKNIKENKKMDTSNLFKFDFGPASGNLFRMSPYGLAVKTQSNSWIAYNAKTGELMDVEVVNFDISKMIYRMPVALNAIKPGDILMHAGKPMFVKEIAAGGNTVRVINYADATVVDILPVKSPFGFNFFTKVTPLFDFSNLGANSDNPFGNMLPFMMLSGENSGDFDPTLLFLASSMNSGNMDFANNPMMLYFLMNRKDKSDVLPFLMMMSGGIFGTPANPSAPVATLK